MPDYLGIDTSNYSTSAALFSSSGEFKSSVKLLSVAAGEKGLRQSDAVFQHVRAFPDVLSELRSVSGALEFEAIGVSDKPRGAEGSYMPCFTAGLSFAKTLSAATGKPLYRFSHQQGHIAAALLSSGKEELFRKEHLAFHLSGGTMELLKVNSLDDITPVCVTRDVTAGQLIDRAGVMLGLAFPAGKALSVLAEKGKSPISYSLKVSEDGICLSGIENKAETLFHKGEAPENIAAFLLETVSSAVLLMIDYARNAYGKDLSVIMAGGVSSSSVLRKKLSVRDNIFFADPELSRDNAVGTAYLTAKAAEGEL